MRPETLGAVFIAMSIAILTCSAVATVTVIATMAVRVAGREPMPPAEPYVTVGDRE